jgi:tricorn protease
MEMHAAVPDHVVWPRPGELPQGIDRQLEKAVTVLQEEVLANPSEIPTLRYATERR